jgi:hypothetical protein
MYFIRGFAGSSPWSIGLLSGFRGSFSENVGKRVKYNNVPDAYSLTIVLLLVCKTTNTAKLGTALDHSCPRLDQREPLDDLANLMHLSLRVRWRTGRCPYCIDMGSFDCADLRMHQSRL